MSGRLSQILCLLFLVVGCSVWISGDRWQALVVVEVYREGSLAAAAAAAAAKADLGLLDPTPGEAQAATISSAKAVSGATGVKAGGAGTSSSAAPQVPATATASPAPSPSSPAAPSTTASPTTASPTAPPPPPPTSTSTAPPASTSTTSTTPATTPAPTPAAPPTTTPAPPPATTSIGFLAPSAMPEGTTTARPPPLKHVTAVCVVGGIRSFTFPRIHRSIRQLADQLGPSKVFLVMHWTQGRGEVGQTRMAVNNASLDKAVKAVDPVYVEVYRDSTCKEVRQAEPSEPCCEDEYVGGYFQFAWTNHCFNVVKKYEEEHNARFDLFVRLRPDLTYLDLSGFPRRERLIAAGVTVPLKNGNTPGDWFWVTSRSSLDWFSLAYEDVRHRCVNKFKCREKLDKLSPGKRQECLAQDAMHSAPEYSPWFHQEPPGAFFREGRRWQFQVVDVCPVIVRSARRADCERLQCRAWECSEQTRRGWDV